MLSQFWMIAKKKLQYFVLLIFTWIFMYFFYFFWHAFTAFGCTFNVFIAQFCSKWNNNLSKKFTLGMSAATSPKWSGWSLVEPFLLRDWLNNSLVRPSYSLASNQLKRHSSILHVSKSYYSIEKEEKNLHLHNLLGFLK